VTVATDQGCLRCAPAADRILGIAGERDATCGRCGRRWPDPLDDRYFEPSLDFNDRLRANAASTRPPMELLDTTELDEGETAAEVARW
jgi:hypothetical protein